ncbi:FG-GAP-like repeat-containing protein [Amycolatopsis anabasis]|uniref:FG-GAP-like repeat-containing protein n=1 Tax=Amycolatopsis anabasis TaxID=1840409 RepID=UPI00131AF149|nr:FG-GAP-like repeat-containing protein [Amycolatopsis anabasis]
MTLVAGVLTSSPAQAVAGGSPAEEGAYPFATKLDMPGRSCTGALIDPLWVVTAGSCFAENGQPVQPGPPKKATTATIGRTVLSKNDGHVVPVSELVPRTDRNLVLAKLATPVTDVAPVKIGTTPPQKDEVLRVAGFGRTKTEWVPDRLQTALFSTTAVAPTTLDIVGRTPPDASICKGDSGSPAFRDDHGWFELVAINDRSWQAGCLGETETRQGAVQARLDNIAGWLEQQMLGLTATPAAKHAIGLRWNPIAGRNFASYKVYGAKTADVPIGPATLLGTVSTPGFTHASLPAKQTWYYRIVPVTAAGQDGQPSATVSATTPVPTAADYTGDDKDDIADFTRGDLADVYVAASDGKAFAPNPAKWQDYFAAGQEVPLSGDFNGDGKTDVATFTRGGSGIVNVALSNGSGFDQARTWHTHFAIGAEFPAVGDFNGDGKDDIATFTRGDSGKVYVSLSDGTKFVQDGWKWHDHFALGNEIPAVGDFNGDGKADIATFTRADSGKVYVSLSDGGQFVQDAWKWHDHFALGNEIPAVGDFDGDGKDDIVTFTRGDLGDVYVSLSDGGKFVQDAWKWHDWFAPFAEIPGIGDFDGDGKADIVTFTRADTGKVYVATSAGNKFVGEAVKWHDRFALGSDIPAPGSILW